MSTSYILFLLSFNMRNLDIILKAEKKWRSEYLVWNVIKYFHSLFTNQDPWFDSRCCPASSTSFPSLLSLLSPPSALGFVTSHWMFWCKCRYTYEFNKCLTNRNSVATRNKLSRKQNMQNKNINFCKFQLREFNNSAAKIQPSMITQPTADWLAPFNLSFRVTVPRRYSYHWL